MKAIFLCESDNVARVFAPEILEKISALTELDKAVYRKEDLQKNPEQFADTEYIFSTWGMTVLTEEEIRQYLPKLKCVFYAAGSVQQFARPYMNCGVKVFSAWAANAVPVAEYASAQIVLAGKGHEEYEIDRSGKHFFSEKQIAAQAAGKYQSEREKMQYEN